jgi:hypothetical protein
MSELPGRDAFAENLHTRFQVVDTLPDLLELELEQVSELHATRWQQTFSAVFRGPAERMMPQHIYHLRHPSLGELELFLVPVGKQGQSILYEVVFNHLTSQ